MGNLKILKEQTVVVKGGGVCVCVWRDMQLVQLFLVEM